MPDRIANAPELMLGLDIFYVGFLDLTTSRQLVGFGTEAPIDWFRIDGYCERQGIEGEQREDFFYFIQHLDSAYLDHKAKKTAKTSKKK